MRRGPHENTIKRNIARLDQSPQKGLLTKYCTRMRLLRCYVRASSKAGRWHGAVIPLRRPGTEIEEYEAMSPGQRARSQRFTSTYSHSFLFLRFRALLPSPLLARIFYSSLLT